ncbi:MAG: amidohydrolase family protein [Pseudomonadota bacterium]
MLAISADSHVVEAKEVYTGLAERFGDDAPRVIHENTIKDSIVVPALGKRGIRRRMAFAGLRLREGVEIQRRHARKPEVDDISSPEVHTILEQGYAGMRAGVRDGYARRDDQDTDGVALEFLYPGFFGMFSFENTDLLVACQKNYNDWLNDYAGAAKGRLFGLAALPMQDPAAAKAELERIIALGYKGACIPCSSPYQVPYHDEVYDPIWALAQEANVPISMHVGTNAWRPRGSHGNAEVRDGVFDYANAQSTIQRTLVELMCRGVATRFPELKFVVAEFNAGWLAHWLDRVDQGLMREARFAEQDHTGEDPMEVWHRQFYCTIEDDRAALLTREIIGVENMLWGSDYPHVDSTWPCSQAVLDEMFEGIPDADRQKMTYDNVRRLYGLQ